MDNSHGQSFLSQICDGSDGSVASKFMADFTPMDPGLRQNITHFVKLYWVSLENKENKNMKRNLVVDRQKK